MLFVKRLVIILLASLSSFSCRKKVDTHIITKSSPQLTLQFANVIDGERLVFHKYYQNAHGDSFYVTKYRYYISNITILGEGGKPFAEPESYHLIDESKADSKKIVLNDFPTGNWNKIRFLIGVDSARNVSGAQAGALDPLLGMFWTWNTGYIMAQLEGSSPAAGSIPNNTAFHIGGFSGPSSVLRWVELPLVNYIYTDSGRQPVIYISSNINEWFKTPRVINFAEMSNISSPGYGASLLAENYADMFAVDSIK